MATEAVAVTAFERIETVLATMATPTYHFTLTDPGQILVGEGVPQGMRKAFVSLSMARIEPTEGQPLGMYTRTLTIPVLAGTPSSSKPRDKLFDAIRLASDIARLIEAERSLNGSVLDVKVALESVAGDEYGLPGMALVQGTIEAYWEAEAGL